MADATTIADLAARLEGYLTQAAGGQARLANLKRLTGGASRDTWSLDVQIAGGPDAGTHRLVLRRNMGGKFSPMP